MNKITILLIIIISTKLGFSQNYQVEFYEYYKVNDTVNQLKVLKEWESKEPKNAQLFTSYFNYYFEKSKESGVALTPNKPQDEALVVEDSLNGTFYLTNHSFYNPEVLNKGFEKINEGIELYPNRLDMRFGKIYVYGEISDWENFTNEIIKTVKYSAKNKNQWTWTNDEKYSLTANEFLSAIQSYQVQLYNTNNDDLLLNMREIANTVLAIYPNSVENLSNLSLTYVLKGEYDTALTFLLKAEKINPNDTLVLNSIALVYKYKEDKKRAIAYYKKIIELGDDEMKELAKKEIKILER